jgi:hypothetical protein
MAIGCVDSRVSPEVIFDAAPGELLVARNVERPTSIILGVTAIAAYGAVVARLFGFIALWRSSH